MPERTLHRYALEELGIGRSARGSTVRVADGEPGDELQVDFGKLGRIPDPESGKQRDLWALVFTPVVSRFSFVWLTHRQTTEDVIAGFEAAWVFFGGIFTTVIPDNMKTVVDQADGLEPRLNQAFVEYAQARGFVIDPARVRSPQDNALMESVIGLYKTECIRTTVFHAGPYRTIGDVEYATAGWVDWYNNRGLHSTLDYLMTGMRR